MERDLIYDVGLHDATDTAYYLACGYRVVAIDADASLVDAARSRFRREIASGRLTLLNVAIGDYPGRSRFWICDGLREWNSLHRSVASRLGLAHHAVEVDSVDFADVLAEHGVPYYLKVDIEQSDRACVDALDPLDRPQYVSMEFTELDDLQALHEAGYTDFKVIIQTPWSGHAQFRGDASATRGASEEGPRAGPSGPFGEDTDGEWQSFDATAYHLLAHLLEQESGHSPNWLVWFDIHATNSDRAGALRPTAAWEEEARWR